MHGNWLGWGTGLGLGIQSGAWGGRGGGFVGGFIRLLFLLTCRWDCAARVGLVGWEGGGLWVCQNLWLLLCGKEALGTMTGVLNISH